MFYVSLCSDASIGGIQFYLKLEIQNQINLWTLDTMTKYWNTGHSYCQLHTPFYLYMTPQTIPSPLSLPPHAPTTPKHSNYCHTLHPLPHAPTIVTFSTHPHMVPPPPHTLHSLPHALPTPTCSTHPPHALPTPHTLHPLPHALPPPPLTTYLSSSIQFHSIYFKAYQLWFNPGMGTFFFLFSFFSSSYFPLFSLFFYWVLFFSFVPFSPFFYPFLFLSTLNSSLVHDFFLLYSIYIPIDAPHSNLSHFD